MPLQIPLLNPMMMGMHLVSRNKRLTHAPRCKSRLWASLLIGLAAAGVLHSTRAQDVDFNRDIRPILSNQCFACHGPDEKERKGGKDGLRLDTRSGATEDLGGYAAIVPGTPDQSELLKRLTAEDPDDRMPPLKSGKRVAPREIQLLRAWISQGAEYDRHWAYIPPKRPVIPSVTRDSWPKNSIDYFVLARMEQEQLSPSERAEPETLIRRMSLDLTGLPPSPLEVGEFIADKREDALERLADRLLNKQSFGEHWARHWLDQARYADSAGYADDPPRTIWAYRDYVIRAFNENKPFDEFTIEQIAGDLLPDPGEEQLIATAFHRNTLTNNEGGTNDEEFRNVAVVDRVNTSFAVWMGATMACAQCHTHKYDPISQEEYFQAFAIFNNTADADKKDESPTLALRESPDAEPYATVPIMRELTGDDRRQTHVQHRGNFLDTGKQVFPGVPLALHEIGTESPNRLDFARWLVDRSNPLTARVTVNRFWESLFGTGLVQTSEDFGTQGELPSHPQLLDWLAVEFMESDWDVKHLLKLIATSATYRQSSKVTGKLYERDPYNRLLARGPRLRLSAEMVRDQALFAGGLLSQRLHGPPVNPPQPEMGLSAAFGSGIDWETSKGENRYRRGLYTTWRRSNPYPSMAAFDAPNREVCVVKRDRTNTPLQALVTLNDPVFVEAAQGLARRMMRAGDSFEERAIHGFRICLARTPSAEELDILGTLRDKALEQYRRSSEHAQALANQPVESKPKDVDSAEYASWIVAANALLNLDETLMKK